MRRWEGRNGRSLAGRKKQALAARPMLVKPTAPAAKGGRSFGQYSTAPAGDARAPTPATLSAARYRTAPGVDPRSPEGFHPAQPNAILSGGSTRQGSHPATRSTRPWWRGRRARHHGGQRSGSFSHQPLPCPAVRLATRGGVGRFDRPGAGNPENKPSPNHETASLPPGTRVPAAKKSASNPAGASLPTEQEVEAQTRSFAASVGGGSGTPPPLAWRVP